MSRVDPVALLRRWEHRLTGATRAEAEGHIAEALADARAVEAETELYVAALDGEAIDGIDPTRFGPSDRARLEGLHAEAATIGERLEGRL